MTPEDFYFPAILVAIWAAWEVAGVRLKLGRIADALERLAALAERGRR